MWIILPKTDRQTKSIKLQDDILVSPGDISKLASVKK